MPIHGHDPRFAMWEHAAFVPHPLPHDTPRAERRGGQRRGQRMCCACVAGFFSPTTTQPQTTSLWRVLAADEDAEPTNANMREILGRAAGARLTATARR